MNTITTAIILLDADLLRLFGEGLDDEERECLLDPGRYDEATEMVDDMEARLGVRASVRGEVVDALTRRETMVVAMTHSAADMMGYGVEPTSAARQAANDGGIDWGTDEMVATVTTILHRMGCDA